MKTINKGFVSRAFRAIAIAVLFIAGTTTNAMAVGYFAQSGRIYDASGQEIQIRGVNHHGFNSPILQPQFLWAMGWKEQIAQMKSLGFNAIRVPFVPDTLYSITPVNLLSYVEPALNPELIGKTPLQVLDLWMAEADRQGMYVLLDFHSVTMQMQYPTWFLSNPADFNLTYNKQAYTKENWTRDLAFVAQRYANLSHFFGIDLYNEPHDAVRWSSGDANVTNPIYFWKDAAELASAAVLAANPRLLVFVQGSNGNYDGIENSNIPMNWGENFQPEGYKPFNIPGDKLVLTPHTYGPDVYVKSSFSASNFPANLAADWNTLFGQFYPANSVVVGEFGGYFGTGTSGQKDVVWQNAFVQYLQSKGMRNSFYWCYTPNSGGTGGILDDNLNVRLDKMALLQKLWATPPSGVPPVAPPPAPVVSLTIFGDAMTPLWALSGWSSTSTVQGQFVGSGVSAVKVAASTWGGISFDSRDANWVWTDQPANLYTHLSFDVSAGPVVGAAIRSLQVSLDLGFGLVAKISNYVPSFAPGTWYHVEIPLSVMNPKGVSFRKIIFQNNTTSNLTFYVDKVELVNRTSGGGGTADTAAPSTPTGLTASAVSSSQNNLSWTASTDNVGVTGYKVFKGGAQIATTTATSYSNTGLAASTAYSYVVSAYDAAGNVSAQSSAAGATTQAVPQPVTGTPIFDDAVNSLWQLSAWSATTTVQGQFVGSGVSAVKVDATTWGGMSLDSRTANWVWVDQPANLYTHLSFDVSAGPVVGAAMSSLEASLDLGFGLAAKISNYVPTFAPGTWYHVEIPLSVMNPAGVPFRKIIFQNNSTSNLTFYVDKVELVNRATTPAPTPTPTPGGQLQTCSSIMPLGDSITLGVNGGYRNNLYTGLQQNNCAVSYVGTQTDVNTRVADKHHEGHPGFTIGDIAGSVNAWMTSTQPGIILLMIGTNDTAWWTGENAAQIGARHNALIDQLRTARPQAWIFVASIPPQSSAIIQPNNIDRAALTQQLDAVIRTNVDARVAAGQRVRFVDINSALTTADLYDGIHPTEAAHAKVAQKFLDAVRAALGP